MKVSFFGVDGSTGRHAFQPMSIEEVAGLAGNQPNDQLKEAEKYAQKRKVGEDALGPTEDVDDPNALGEAGWGIVWGESITQEIKDALRPLIERREEIIQATRRVQDTGTRLYELTFKRTDTIQSLRVQYRFSPGPVSANVMPAYLLLVGPPTDISFELQHDLDIDFFVGRIDFDTVEQYSAYAKAVVAAEYAPKRPKKVTFFGTRHPNDDATALSLPNLVTPLAKQIEDRKLATVERKLGDDATKAALAEALSDKGPAVLFTGGHGAVFRAFATNAERELQRELQGALITQEWPNDPNRFGPLPVEERFAASDLTGNVDGLVAVFFACYGGGTPRKSRFPYSRKEGIRDLAPTDFTAKLPKEMLARGAGAVIAHVERTWDTGFSWQEVQGPQIDVWTAVVQALLKGKRAGRAVAYLNERYASIGARLSQALADEENLNIVLPDERKAYLWTQNQDARGWVLIGDPAVRVAIA